MYRFAFGLLAVATTAIWACGGNVVVDPGTGVSETDTEDTFTDLGTDTLETDSSETDDDTEATDTGNDPCFCACELVSSEGGCADICSSGLGGNNTPNFCDGAMALSQCAMCLQELCGISSNAQPCLGM